MRVLITDHPFESLSIAKEIFSSNGIEMEELNTATPEVILARAPAVDAILSGMAKIDGKIIDALGQCKIIVRLGTGYDTIDVKAASAKGIMVANVPDFCMDEVSDHAVAFIVTAGRKILEGHKVVHAGKWGPRSVNIDTFYRLRGQVLGLFGYGRISRLTALKAQAFGIHCLAYDPFVSKEDMAEAGVEKVEMDVLLNRSDFISLHAPLNEKTEHFFDINKFRSMKKSAWIINTARGPVIKEEDLVTALDQGLIAGAALDVLEFEPPDKDKHPLLNRDNVIVTPHIGWMSLGARDDMQRKGVEEIVRVLKGESPVNVVNLGSL